MERLFTEAQWRAITEVEERSHALSYLLPKCASKPLMGGAFGQARFLLAWSDEYLPRNIFGPPEVGYFVYESSSELIFTFRVEDRVAAIDAARARIRLIGPEYLQHMIEEARSVVAAREAEFAKARLAAAVKAQRRLKKIPRRTREVFAASNGKCHYCACALELGGKWHIEHKMPRALKGGSEMHNLVAACVPCNMRKKDKTDLEFQALLATESAIAQASQGGFMGADPSGRFDSLNSHAAEFSLREPRNATQLSGGRL